MVASTIVPDFNVSPCLSRWALTTVKMPCASALRSSRWRKRRMVLYLLQSLTLVQGSDCQSLWAALGCLNCQDRSPYIAAISLKQTTDELQMRRS